MPTATQIAAKWEREYQASAESAAEAYTSSLDGLADQIIADKADIITAFTKAINSAAYDAALRAGLNEDVAGVAYQQVMDRIEASGFTPHQKSLVEDEVLVRRHLGSLIPSIRALATGANGKLKFPAGISNQTKDGILNRGLMRNIGKFSTTTTAPEAETVLIADAANINDLSVGS